MLRENEVSGMKLDKEYLNPHELESRIQFPPGKMYS